MLLRHHLILKFQSIKIIWIFESFPSQCVIYEYLFWQIRWKRLPDWCTWLSGLFQRVESIHYATQTIQFALIIVCEYDDVQIYNVGFWNSSSFILIAPFTSSSSLRQHIIPASVCMNNLVGLVTPWLIKLILISSMGLPSLSACMIEIVSKLHHLITYDSQEAILFLLFEFLFHIVD